MKTSLCDGNSYANYDCNTVACPVQTKYEWSTFTFHECSASCGGGSQWGTRSCLIQGTNQLVNDSFCVADGSKSYTKRDCNPRSCSPPTQIKSGEPSCGYKPKEMFKKTGPQNVQLRITDGAISGDGDWPWQVSLQHRTCRKSGRFNNQCTWKHMCGASIVDNRWIVTAAHCIEESGYYTDNNNPGDDWAIVVGMDRLNYEHEFATGKGPDGRADGRRFMLKKIIPHPNYAFKYITHSDVALLQLREAIEYADDVQPICMPNGREPAHGENCHITGWGYTHGKGRFAIFRVFDLLFDIKIA